MKFFLDKLLRSFRVAWIEIRGYRHESNALSRIVIWQSVAILPPQIRSDIESCDPNWNWAKKKLCSLLSEYILLTKSVNQAKARCPRNYINEFLLQNEDWSRFQQFVRKRSPGHFDLTLVFHQKSCQVKMTWRGNQRVKRTRQVVLALFFRPTHTPHRISFSPFVALLHGVPWVGFLQLQCDFHVATVVRTIATHIENHKICLMHTQIHYK